MRQVGEVVHQARSGRVIVRILEGTIAPGSVLVDSKGKKAVRVMELIGPVASPYASTAPISDRSLKKGQTLFV